MSTNSGIKEKIKPSVNTPVPRMFKVVYINDDITPMDFVIDTLIVIFGHSASAATEICTMVHEKGSAVVATLPLEIAEQKKVETIVLARNNGFPLAIQLQ